MMPKYDTIFYYLTKYNIEIMVTEPIDDMTTMPSSMSLYDDTQTKDLMTNMSTFIARYNGTKDIYPEFPSRPSGATPLKVNVKYYEVKNEYAFTKGGSVENLMHIQREFYNTVKAKNPHAKVMGAGYASTAIEEKSLCEYVDEFGKKYLDYVDIITFHIYPYNLESYRIVKDSLIHWGYGLRNKECWMGELGASNIYSKHYTGSELWQANQLIIGYILALSNGMTRILNWSFECTGNYFGNGDHGSYGLVGTCVDGSFGSFFKHNTNESASGSERDKKTFMSYPINRGYFEMAFDSTDETHKAEIKANGLDIGGYKHTITKVALMSLATDGTIKKEKVLFEGSYTINQDNILYLTQDKFTDINFEVLRVYATPLEPNSNFLFDPKQSYFSIKKLYDMFLNTGSSYPNVEVYDNRIYCASWINGNNEKYRAFWIDSIDIVRVEMTGVFNATFYDVFGNEKKIDPTNVEISNNILFVKNSNENMKIKIKDK